MKYFFDEVNAVDKYEYKLKTDQMLELMEDGAYSKAAAIADEIDWKRVRNAVMLTNVSDIYDKNGEYRKSYDVLTIAYHRAEGSRKIISRLCSLAIQTGNVDEAIDYYDDFMQIAPKDPNQYILKYQILRAQRAPIEQQIEALEEYKKSEYIEEWAYELARLYQEAGMTAECLEECDDLILWFSEGQYVYKAMELKMQFKPLTPSQQEKYDHRYEKFSAETEEMPDIAAYVEEKENVQSEALQENSGTAEQQEESTAGEKDQTAETKEAEVEKSTEEIKKSAEAEETKTENLGKRKKLGDTMPLGEALRRLLHPETSEDDKDGEGDNAQEEEPKLDDLEEAIGEIESVADIDMAERVAEKRRKPISLAGGMKEIIPDILDETEEEEAETFESVSSDITEEDQIEGQLSLEDIISEWEGKTEEESIEVAKEPNDLLPGFDVLTGKEAIAEEESEESEELKAEDLEEAEEFEELEELEAEDVEEAEELEELEELEAEDVEEAEEFEELEELEAEDVEEAEEFEELEELEAEDVEEAEEFEELEELEAEDIEEAEAFGGEILNETENLSQNLENDDDLESNAEKGEKEGENMNRIKKTEPILPPDIQRMIDEIEGVLPPEEERVKSPARERRQIDEPRENMGKIADELRIDEDDEFEEDLFDDDYAIEEAEEYFDEEELPDGEYLEEADEYSDETLEEDPEEFEEEDLFVDESDSEDLFEEDSEEDDQKPDFEEEFRINPEHTSGPDDREIPDDDDDGIDIMSATTPLSRKETAKLIATGKTAPLPLDEISDALSMSDTGFIVHGRYDLEMQSGIGTRAGLTEEQKKLFSYFVPVRGMSEQLVDVLEQDKNCTNRGGTSRTGNLLIIGNKGNGKTVLAVDVVKAIQRQRNIRQGKVAIVTGDSLNKKKISDIFDKLYGGALIIEKAGKMNEKTVARLNKAMERESGELLIVLEEQRKPLDRLLSSNREFRRKFTSRLEVPIFINDELVTFGQTYAQENGYKIDEMGILALYSKIDSLQREDHAVTVAEVKEIMDDAIRHSQKASAKKLVKRVFGRNTDDADRILLSEKDFNI